MLGTEKDAKKTIFLLWRTSGSGAGGIPPKRCVAYEKKVGVGAKDSQSNAKEEFGLNRQENEKKIEYIMCVSMTREDFRRFAICSYGTA